MNVQKTILKGIREQLFFNDYLVLPGFGGFVLKSQHAQFSGSGGSILPPSKTVSFNSQLKQNDGILVSWLQKSLKCSAVDAQTHLKDFTEFCTGILNAKRRISLEGIGFFYLDFENNICFEPQADVNFLTDSFGLSATLVQVLEKEKREVKKEVFVDRQVPHPSEQPVVAVNKLRNRALMAPLLLSVLILSLVLLLVANTSNQGVLHASLFSEKSKTDYSPLKYPELQLQMIAMEPAPYITGADGIASIEIVPGKTLPVMVVENTTNTSAASHLIRGRFEIVLGCFSISQNAEKMVRKLSREKIRAFVSGKNVKGMFVVSHGKYQSKSEAVDQLIELKARYPKAWVKENF